MHAVAATFRIVPVRYGGCRLRAGCCRKAPTPNLIDLFISSNEQVPCVKVLARLRLRKGWVAAASSWNFLFLQ